MDQPTTSTSTMADREFTLHYTFDAPRAAVYAAYTDPKLVAKWWGPKGTTTRIDKMEVRPGGAWRFVQTGGGKEMAFSGVYKEVKPVSRLSYTFVTEGMQQPELLATVDLVEAGGKTKLTLTNLCASKQQRDAMLQYGAQAGANVAWDRLAVVLKGA